MGRRTLGEDPFDNLNPTLEATSTWRPSLRAVMNTRNRDGSVTVRPDGRIQPVAISTFKWGRFRSVS